MHFSWLAEKKESPEATWEEQSYFYRPNYYKITVSERDHIERATVYFNETIIEENEALSGCDFLPLNFLSSYYIVTHQGKLILMWVIKTLKKKNKENSCKLKLKMFRNETYKLYDIIKISIFEY